jgi:hypothetical protein
MNPNLKAIPAEFIAESRGRQVLAFWNKME